MTRKDSVLIADAIARIEDASARNLVANLLVSALSVTNPWFRGEIFLDYVEKKARD